MSKLDTAKTVVDIVKSVVDIGLAVSDARRRAREEEATRKKEQGK